MNSLDSFVSATGGGGGANVMSLLEEVDAFISDEPKANFSYSGRSSNSNSRMGMAVDSFSKTMNHNISNNSMNKKPSAAASAMYANYKKRRVSTDDTASMLGHQKLVSSSTKSKNSSASSVASSAIAAFLQKQAADGSTTISATSRSSTNSNGGTLDYHKMKRQRVGEPSHNTLDSFEFDLMSATSQEDFPSVPAPAPQFQQQQPRRQPAKVPASRRHTVLSQSPQLPTAQQFQMGQQQYHQQQQRSASLSFPVHQAQQQQIQQQQMQMQPPAPQPTTHQRSISAATSTTSSSASLSSKGQTTSTATAAAAAASLLAASPQFNLHQVCNHFASKREVVQIALALDPQAIRRKVDAAAPAKAAATRKSSSSANKTRRAASIVLTPQRGLFRERYAYPINIAIQNKASMSVLELLVSHGKDVVVEKDGYEKTASLSIALCHRPRDLDLVDLILFANLQGVMVTDRKLNYPLHIACAKGASVEVLQRLYLHYPAALFQQNFNSETPLDICRRTSLMSEEALNFLLERYNEGCSKVAQDNCSRYSQRMLVDPSSRAA